MGKKTIKTLNILAPEDFETLDSSDWLEEDIQEALCVYFYRFIQPIHPNCILIVNPFSSVKMSLAQMSKAKTQGYRKGQPDLVLIYNKGGKSGLALELKRDKEKVYNKKGNLKNPHLEEQKGWLDKFIANGYQAIFSIGYHKSLKIMKNYFA